METERLAFDAFDDRALRRAAELLRGGRLVAFPTETVYGLGARADDATAVRAIFAAKGRPRQNPLIVHVASLAAARELSEAWSEGAERLAAAFWPGPLTLVVRRREGTVAPEVAAFGPTVAVRVPAHPVALALLEATGLPIAAPSANRSAAISPTTADHVMKSLGGRIDLVLDGGETGGRGLGVKGYGIESAIVDVSRSPAVLLRHGALSRSELEAYVPMIDRGAAIVSPSEIAPAPGGYARHYAPQATVLLVPAAAALSEAQAQRARGAKVGLFVRASGGIDPRGDALAVEALPDDPAAYAAGLYAALHRLEDVGCEVIVIAEVPASPAWAAVADRLRRAAA
jgi:L-threonylcarbamoyladenylate synthase